MWRSCLLVTSTTTFCKNSFHCFYYCFLLGSVWNCQTVWREPFPRSVVYQSSSGQEKTPHSFSRSLETILIIIAASPGNGCDDSRGRERMKHYENMCRRRPVSWKFRHEEDDRLTIFIQSLNITTFDTWFGSYWTCDRSLKGVVVIKSAVSVWFIFRRANFPLALLFCPSSHYTYAYTTNLQPPIPQRWTQNKERKNRT